MPFFYNYGVNTVILRNRLRRDGYNPQTDAVNDAMQAIRMVRAYAKEMEHRSEQDRHHGLLRRRGTGGAAAVLFEDSTRRTATPAIRWPDIVAPRFRRHHLSRPDAVRAQSHRAADSAQCPARLHRLRRLGRPRPRRLGDGILLARCWRIGVPNIEMHIYGNGRHPGDPLPDGSRMTGGLTDRNGIPFGTWQYRFIDWFRDLGFLQKPGVETKAAKDVARVRRPACSPVRHGAWQPNGRASSRSLLKNALRDFWQARSGGRDGNGGHE